MTTVRHSKIFIVGMDGWTQTLHGYCIIIQIPGFFPVSCFLNKICGHTHAACGILVPWSGIEPVPTVLSAQTLNHWTTREVPVKPLLLLLLLIFLFWFPNLLPFKIWVLNWGGKKKSHFPTLLCLVVVVVWAQGWWQKFFTAGDNR